MDKLKQLFDNKPEEFSSQAEFFTAPSDAWDAISERLEEEENQGGKQLNFTQQFFHYGRRLAAGLAVLLVLWGGLSFWFSQESTETQFVAAYPELAETEAFYTQVLAQKEGVIRSKVGQEAYRTELEALEEEYRELKESLSEGTNSEEIINSMIQNYRLRVELLEELLKQINHEQEPKIHKTDVHT